MEGDTTKLLLASALDQAVQYNGPASSFGFVQDIRQELGKFVKRLSSSGQFTSLLLVTKNLFDLEQVVDVLLGCSTCHLMIHRSSDVDSNLQILRDHFKHETATSAVPDL